MTQATEISDAVRQSFSKLDQSSAASSPTWLHSLRKKGLASFHTLGFPTTENEEWIYTNISAIAQMPFQLPEKEAKVAKEQLSKAALSDFGGLRLVFVDGKYSEALSSINSATCKLPEGVVLTNLAGAIKTHPKEIEASLGKIARFENQAFAALSTAFIQDGIFLQVDANKILEAPIHLLFVSSGAEEDLASFPRNLLVLGQGSSASVIEHYVSLGSRRNFTAPVTEISIGENAKLEHYKIQHENDLAHHVGTIQANQSRNSRLHSLAVCFGGKLVRNDINTKLDGQGAEASLDGLYVAKADQHVDYHTTIDHQEPHCNSRELYKGILDGQSKAVFNGKVIVRPGAQKTDSVQTNKNLLLSEGAEINTKPQLEIFADDVKCKHGATIGRLDENSIFYLRSRGIGEEEARQLLSYAFVGEIVARIQNIRLRAQLDRYFFDHLSRGHWS